MRPTESHTERVRAYFDSHAEDWQRAYESVERANDVVLAERLRLALDLTSDLPPGSRVLDAGCGTGPLTVALVDRGDRVDAADVSPEMMERCRENLERAGATPEAYTLHCGEIATLGLEEGSFEVVFALGFLQYQVDEVRALRELRRLLVPGGRLIVSGPIGRRLGNVFGLWDGVRRLRRRWEGRARQSAAGQRELAELLAISPHTYSQGRMRRLLGEAGFEVVSHHPHGFVNYALIGPWLGTRGELAAHRLFTRLARWTPVGRFANDLVTRAVALPETAG